MTREWTDEDIKKHIEQQAVEGDRASRTILALMALAEGGRHDELALDWPHGQEDREQNGH